MLYTLVLFLHSYVRWAVLVAGVVVVVRSFVAWRRGLEWRPRDETAHKVLIGSADLQMLLGLLLYVFLSPITKAFFADPRHAVHDHVLRFFGIEHVTMMLIAVTVVHLVRTRSVKATKPALRHRHVWIGNTVFLALVCSSVPWPGLRHGRPLLRTEVPGARPTTETAAACPPLYESRCAMCHGASGRADGIAGASLKPPPRNFTDAKWQAATDDLRIHDVIHDGGFAHALSAAMPAQPDLAPADLAALTKCIRSFATKTP
ncbi:MAG TPA: cytochrome c [Polyangiaceae bacterium]|nr:cytochrome c [Polyangiaceae bacterium]